MIRAKFTSPESVDITCKRIEELIRNTLGTKPNKTKEDKFIIYYPARKFMDTDDDMDDVRIIVTKVNNTTTSIKIENTQYHEQHSMFDPGPSDTPIPFFNWRTPALIKAYEILEKCLRNMYT